MPQCITNFGSGALGRGLSGSIGGCQATARFWRRRWPAPSRPRSIWQSAVARATAYRAGPGQAEAGGVVGCAPGMVRCAAGTSLAAGAPPDVVAGAPPEDVPDFGAFAALGAPAALAVAAGLA